MIPLKEALAVAATVAVLLVTYAMGYSHRSINELPSANDATEEATANAEAAAASLALCLDQSELAAQRMNRTYKALISMLERTRPGFEAQEDQP